MSEWSVNGGPVVSNHECTCVCTVCVCVKGLHTHTGVAVFPIIARFRGLAQAAEEIPWRRNP